MNAGVVRALVIVVCVAGIAGMIVGSIADNNAVAMTFGLVTAAAVLCLIVANAVTGGAGDPDLVGQDVEARVVRLVEAGADESQVRGLVRTAVKLGQSGR
jgi:hypothetical protein